MTLAAGAITDIDDFSPYQALTGAWTDWSSTFAWTATSVNPAVGNGTKSAKYIQVGKLVIFTASIIMGTTTTYGTGTWLFSVPFTSATTDLHAGVSWLVDQGTATNRQPGVVRFNTTSNVTITGGSGGPVAAAIPFTWASTDRIGFTLVYESV